MTNLVTLKDEKI